MGKASPYGIYDLKHNLGYGDKGISAVTQEFAVDAIVNWWQYENRPRFAQEQKWLILADAGVRYRLSSPFMESPAPKMSGWERRY